ncbi:hypothetical protein EDB19DRAFT_1629487, partial [Suillus lakei]
NVRAINEYKVVLFNPLSAVIQEVADSFRVFVDPTLCHPSPALPLPIITPAGLAATEVTIGGFNKINKDSKFEAGGGIWFGLNDAQTEAIRVPHTLASYNSGVLVAAQIAIRLVPYNEPINILIKLNRLIKELTIDLARLEEFGWAKHPDKHLM